MSTVETPTQAMAHAANAVPAAEREAVIHALPRLQTDDFAEAARQIREAGKRVV